VTPRLEPDPFEPEPGPARVKPRLRGVFHQWAFVVSLATGTALVLLAGGVRATVAAAIFAATVSSLFGVSALYHRITWRPVARSWMRRLDHSMIFLLIAGTYTPVGLLVLHQGLAAAVLWVVWGGAIAGIVVKLAWPSAPRWLGVVIYLALGWVAVVAMPQLATEIGLAGVGLLLVGGLAYSVGALIYARRRPDPIPAVFGYHEIFHVLVIVGVLSHMAAIAIVLVTPPA
jgi:hemolysin III